MERRSYAFFTGLFLLLIASGAAAFVWWLSRSDVEYLPYDVVSEHSVSGLTPHSTVYLRGVAVGKTLSIDFHPDDFEKIVIRIEVDSQVSLPTETFATLRNQGVTGLAQILLDAENPSGVMLQTSKASPAEIPMRQGTLDRLLSQGEELMESANNVMNNLAKISSAENAKKITQLLDNMQIVSEEFIALEREAQGLPTQAKQALAEAEQFAAKLNGMTQQIERFVRNADRMAVKTSAVVDEVDSTTMPKLYQTLEEVSAAAKNIRSLSNSIETDPQSLIFGNDPPAPGPGEPGY